MQQKPNTKLQDLLKSKKVKSHKLSEHSRGEQNRVAKLNAMLDELRRGENVQNRWLATCLPQIKNCLNELGLKFCEFEDQDIVSRFKEFHNEGSDICDLTLWHQFEESNPRAFVRM